MEPSSNELERETAPFVGALSVEHCAGRVLYPASEDFIVSCVVTIVNPTTPAAGFEARDVWPLSVHVNVCAPSPMFAVTVNVRILPELLVKAVTVPVLGVVHVGTVLSTKMAVPESVVIVTVSDTSLTPALPVFNAWTVVNMNVRLVGGRP